MLKILKFTVAAVAILFVGVQFIRPARINQPIAEGQSIEARIPVTPEAEAVLNRSCRDCHSNRTEWPWYSHVAPMSWLVIDHVNHGRRRLNFSDWSRYDRRESQQLLKAICRTAKRGEMPLDSYTLIHRQAKLSTEDVQALCDWAQSEGQRLASAQGK
ncbi:MAG: heme-binding domain-containing protein [Acidobacteria bacterium]|nr:heme-binding domain-containing protein [Acidobacteriota bacterium]